MRFAVLTLVCSLTILSGCGGPTRLPPSIGIGTMESQSVVGSAEGQTLKMVVHVDIGNHEDKAIELESAEYRLEVAGMRVGTGTYRGTGKVVIAAGGRIALALPLDIDYRRLVGTSGVGRSDAGPEGDSDHKGMVRAALIGAMRFRDNQGHEGYHEPIDAVVWVPLPH